MEGVVAGSSSFVYVPSRASRLCERELVLRDCTGKDADEAGGHHSAEGISWISITQNVPSRRAGREAGCRQDVRGGGGLEGEGLDLIASKCSFSTQPP